MTTTLDEIRARMKRLNSEAGRLKMDLHDLAEDLPNGWERTMEVAGRTYEAYRQLAELKEQLKMLEGKV